MARVSASQRGRALGVYAMAGLIGMGLAFIIGGLLVHVIAGYNFTGVPVLGGLAPWALTLICAEAAGLPLALLVMTFREPARPVSGDARGMYGFRTTWRLIKANRAIYLPLAVFSVAQAMLAQSLQVWIPALLGIRFGLNPAQIGPTLGLMLIVIGPIGLFGAGAAIDTLNRQDWPGAALIAVGVSLLLLAVTPFHPIMPSIATFWIFQGLVLLAINTDLVVTSSLVAQIAPGFTVGKTMALFLVLQGLLDAGFGPAVTGYVSEHFPVALTMPLAGRISLVHGSLALVSLVAALALCGACLRTVTSLHRHKIARGHGSARPS